MLTNLLIGLREGLEASLVVGILVAYVRRSGLRHRLDAIWVGVGTAVALSAAFGTALYFTARELADRAEPRFAGSLGLVAVVFVSYMVFWMRRAAHSMRADLEGRTAQAVRMGAFALAVTAFVAVAREGLETALFLWTNIQNNTGTGALPLIGALLGLVTSVVLEYLLYRSAVRINLARFFRVTGAMLIIVVAGGPVRQCRGPAGRRPAPGRACPGLQHQRCNTGEQLVRSAAERNIRVPPRDDLADAYRVGRLSGPGSRPVPATRPTPRGASGQKT